MPKNPKQWLRNTLRKILSRTPYFRGKGRITLALDSILTNFDNPASFVVQGPINNDWLFNFDLRAWGQKFAYYYGVWEWPYVRILRSLYRGGMFIDVGSSLGLYVVCMSDLVAKEHSQIISIEPVPLNLDRQKHNVGLNRLNGLVRYFPVALGAKPGHFKMVADPMKADNNAFIADEGEISVEVTTLDALATTNCFSNIGCIKMDIEGFEPFAIDGAKYTITRDRPVILAEFNRERMAINKITMADSWNFLVSDLKYRCFSLNVKSLDLEELSDPAEKENLFFLP